MGDHFADLIDLAKFQLNRFKGYRATGAKNGDSYIPTLTTVYALTCYTVMRIKAMATAVENVVKQQRSIDLPGMD